MSFAGHLTRRFSRWLAMSGLANCWSPTHGALLLLSACAAGRVRLYDRTTVAGRDVVRVRPHRLRRDDATDLAKVERSYLRYGALLGRALARARGEGAPEPQSATLVTYQPFVAAFCDAPWISNVVYFGRDDWATDEAAGPVVGVCIARHIRRIDRTRCHGSSVCPRSLPAECRRAHRSYPTALSPTCGVRGYPVPARIAALPGPRAIYTGTSRPPRCEPGRAHRDARSGR